MKRGCVIDNLKFLEMANSSSIKQAQTIKPCELCQEDSIKWRCIDCDNCLCNKCKIIHMRIKVTSQHQIVTIGTPLQCVQKKIFIDNIPCIDHPKKMICLFCQSCDSLICPDCVSSNHKKHEFASIESALDEKLDYLRDIHDKIDDNLKSCESKTSEVQGIKSRYNAIFDEYLTKIKLKEQELIDSIRKYSKKLQEEVEIERSKVYTILSKINQDVNDTKKNLEDQREEIDHTLTSSQGSVIFKTTMTIKDITFDFPPDRVQQFIPEPESTKKIQELFGSLQMLSIPTTDDLHLMDFEVIRTFTTDLPYIDTLVKLGGTSAWINCRKTQVIRKVNIQDNNMTKSQEIRLHICDMVLTHNNELLLSMFEGSDIRLLKKSGKIVSVMSVAPLLPCGIHVTKDNDVMIGVSERGAPYTPTDQSTRAVIVSSMQGKQKEKYQANKDGKRLFTFPKFITTNINQNILVVDKTSEYTGRVVVLTKEGNLRWFYKGNSNINASEQFDPRSIVTTKVGHIIVCDLNSHALHVISENGEALMCKEIGDKGIMTPWGLDIDCEGKLWLGCGTSGKETGAKLHIIKLV